MQRVVMRPGTLAEIQMELRRLGEPPGQDVVFYQARQPFRIASTS